MAATSATSATPVMNEMDLARAWINDFQRFSAELPRTEPSALHLLRREAIERYAEIGFPTTRWEQWRATNVAPIARPRFRQPPKSPASVDSAALAPHLWESA